MVGLPVGQKGAPWSQEQITIIREKLRTLWANPREFAAKFDEWNKKEFDQDHGKYLYDPLEKTTKVDCSKIKVHIDKEEDEKDKFDFKKVEGKNTTYFKYSKNCKRFWNIEVKDGEIVPRKDSNHRLDDLAFTERKMLRLAFHDCVPFTDGTGGCNGCLNMDEDNIHDNNGLHYTLAILVSLTFHDSLTQNVC